MDPGAARHTELRAVRGLQEWLHPDPSLWHFPQSGNKAEGQGTWKGGGCVA